MSNLPIGYVENDDLRHVSIVCVIPNEFADVRNTHFAGAGNVVSNPLVYGRKHSQQTIRSRTRPCPVWGDYDVGATKFFNPRGASIYIDNDLLRRPIPCVTSKLA